MTLKKEGRKRAKLLKDAGLPFVLRHRLGKLLARGHKAEAQRLAVESGGEWGVLSCHFGCCTTGSTVFWAGKQVHALDN